MSATTDTTPDATDNPATDGGPAGARKDGSLLGDRVIAVLVVALGAFLLVQAFGFPSPGQPEDPGTAALPQLIGAALVLLGVMLLFNTEKNVFLPEPGARMRTVLIVIASVAYAFALTPLGFMLSTLIFMVLGLLIMGIRSIVRLVLVPLVIAVVVYYLFTDALGVYLPSGVIEGVLP